MPSRAHEDWIRGALERYERKLCLYAQRLLGDPERARDVVQDAFLRLCREPRDRIEGHLAEWLFTVCRNRALDLRAKESPMRDLEDARTDRLAGAECDPSERAQWNEDRGRLRRLVHRLPEAQREVLLLKFEQGLSYREIGSLTGHSIANVGFLLHRAMATLRERLGGEIRQERTGS